MMESKGPRSLVWCDTDAGFDDLLALGALARSGNLHFVTTTSGACEDAKVGALRVRGILHALDCNAVNVVAGLDAPHVPNERWLQRARARMISWAEANLSNEIPAQSPHVSPPENMLVDAPAEDATAEDELQAMLAAVRDFLHSAEDNSIHILTLGPLSNIAKVMSIPPLAQLVRQKVGGLTIMGGNHVFAKTEDVRPEFNFMGDPAATAAVLSSSSLLPITNIVGSDVCTSDDPAHSAGVERLSQGSDILSSLARTDWYACVADPLAAYCALHQDKVEWSALNLAIDPSSGVVSEDLARSLSTVRIAASVPARVEYFDWLVQNARVKP